MSAFFIWPGVAVCAFIVLACICRVNLMRFGENKLGWLALYILWPPAAGGMLLDLLTAPEAVNWWACCAIAGILVHIVLTRGHWSDGAPYYTRLQEQRQ